MIVTFNATGETPNKYIGSISDGYTNIPGVTCQLWDTFYYRETSKPSKFNYKLTNTNSTQKTVKLTFRALIIVKNSDMSTTFLYEDIIDTVTVGSGVDNAVTINGVSKTETILFGENCGFPHAYGTSSNPVGFMEKDVWKFVYQTNFTINNSTISSSDIFWEWIVNDNSSHTPSEKQFLIYPYGTSKGTAQNGSSKVIVEANDYRDEYDSKVTLRAKSRSTGLIYSSDYVFYFTAVNH